MTLDQALCRCDFLESAPGKADRMHWRIIYVVKGLETVGNKTFEAVVLLVRKTIEHMSRI